LTFNPLILLTFASAGFTLKVADVWGERKKGLPAYGASAAAAFLFWLLLQTDGSTATLMVAVVLGSLASLKVDRLNLVFGLAFLAALSAGLGFQHPKPVLLAALTALGFLDEKLHDHWGSRGGTAFWFFRLRGLMKVGAVSLGLTGQLTVFSVAGFMVFDSCYDLSSLLPAGRVPELSRRP